MRELSGLSDDLRRSYETVIDSLSIEPQLYFGHSDTPVFFVLEVVSRPASAIVKCRVQFEQSELRIYIKLFRLKKTSSADGELEIRRMKKDVEITSLLYERFRDRPGQKVARIIGCFPEQRGVVTEESKGDLLLDIIDKYGIASRRHASFQKLETHCHSVGQWLKEFQRITATSNRIANLEAEIIPYVNLRLGKLRGMGKLTEDECKPVLKYLEWELRHVNHTDMYQCGVHGDFGPSNILIDSNGVTVLDFAMYNVGLPYMDLAYLYQRIDNFLTKPWFRRETIKVLQRAFLDGYEQDFDLHNPLFKVLRVRHMVNRLVDLVNTEGLPRIKKLYQCWQQTKCLADLGQLVRNSL